MTRRPGPPLLVVRARPIIGETPNASAASPSRRRESAELVAVSSPSASTVHILFISLFIALFHCSFTVHPRINSGGAHPLVDFIGHALMPAELLSARC